MVYKNKKKMILLTFFCVSVFFFGYLGWSYAVEMPQEEVSTEKIDESTVLVGGMPVGIYMETEGVLVLDTQSIQGMHGEVRNPARNLVKAGDYIIAVNGEIIPDKKALIQVLHEMDEKEVVLKLRRQKEVLEVKLEAVECDGHEYKLGIWVRDNVQGLGTVTFLTGNSQYGALGHGIHDVDTNVLMDIQEGSLYRTSIRSVVKGENGIPGSMEGMIVYNEYNRLGTVEKNTETGIYGTIQDMGPLFEEQIPVRVAQKEEIEVGSAKIRCFLNGKIQEYEIQITDVDYNAKEINKGIVLQVTDPRLLEETGGIIQGMSGSPILQNGKLIGAVTHVFVNDPSKGYGIFAETMLQQL